MQKALSQSITSLIIIIVSVLLIIVVVTLAFNYVGYFSGNSGTISQVGTATLTTDGKLTITIKSTFQKAQIIGVIYASTFQSINPPLNLSEGVNSYNINTGLRFSPQQTPVQLVLVIVANGQSISLVVSAYLNS
ncbi:MAG: hypothetical protein QXD56_07880 [Saccharolobus sp.]